MEFVDALLELVERLSVDIVCDFGDSRLLGQLFEFLDELVVSGEVACSVGEHGEDTISVGVLCEVEELLFNHTLFIFFQVRNKVIDFISQ